MAIMTPIGVAREGRKEGRKEGGKEGRREVREGEERRGFAVWTALCVL